MDRLCYEILSQLSLSDIHLITLEDFERGDDELLKAKQNRTTIEYYFTCAPSLPLYILNKYPEVDFVTYLDADLFFFADPSPIYDEIAHNSIAIIEHRFHQDFRYLEQVGNYNVGWLSFRRDENAFACLHWWCKRCIEWCHDRVVNGRFADQKYLDDWPTLFKGVVVLCHKGANLAPWNIANYKIHEDGKNVWVDDQPLIFFHYHGFKKVNAWFYDPGLTQYKVKLSKVIRERIYSPYIGELIDASQQISPFLPKGSLLTSIRVQTHIPLLRRIARLLKICKGIFFRDYILFRTYR